jgi:hypothetical protein
MNANKYASSIAKDKEQRILTLANQLTFLCSQSLTIFLQGITWHTLITFFPFYPFSPYASSWQDNYDTSKKNHFLASTINWVTTNARDYLRKRILPGLH